LGCKDWLNPANKTGACFRRTISFWKKPQRSSGSSRQRKIIIEPKDEIVKRIGRSTDYYDPLANTFYPHDSGFITDEQQIINDFR
jgi:hypothetical protein